MTIEMLKVYVSKAPEVNFLFSATGDAKAHA